MRHFRTRWARVVAVLVALLAPLTTGCAIDWKVAVSQGTQTFIYSLLDPTRYLDSLGAE